MTDVLKLAEEALVAMRTTRRGPGCYCPDGWDAPAAILHHARCTATRKALAALETARAEWGWRPIAEMKKEDEFNQATILGRWGLWCGQPPERWCLGNCGHMSRSEAIKSGYTHSCRPQLPPPPAREEVGNG